MIYINNILSSSEKDKYEKALELGNELLEVKREKRKIKLQLLDLQLAQNKNQREILELKKELRELGVDYEEGKSQQEREKEEQE